MTKIKLENIAIVLSRPLFAGNLGSVARAMMNMGLSRLRIVSPQAEPTGEEAVKMACEARTLLQAAERYETLGEAVADRQLIIGTTRRAGLVRQHALGPRALAERLTHLSQTARVAVIFGNEGTGLSNEEIAFSQWLVTIPTDPAHQSVNLAQAVMILAYELYLAQSDQPSEPILDLAPGDSLEAMYSDLKAVLLSIGFLDANNPERIMFAFRRFLGRAKLEKRDVKILRGMVRQIKWYSAHPKTTDTP